MRQEQRGEFKINIYESYSEFKQLYPLTDRDCHIIEIKSEDPNEIKDEGFYWGTRTISWEKDLSKDFYFNISDGSAKKIRKSINRCNSEGIRVVEQDTIDPETYYKWLETLYLPFINSKNQDPYIDREWLNSDFGQSHKGVFYFHQDRLVAGNFYKIKKNGDLSFSFKAIDHTLGFDLNAVMEFTSYTIGKRLNAKHIRKGIDYNLYGAYLSVGLAEYKSKFGYYPVNYVSIRDKELSYFRYISIKNSSIFAEEVVTFVSNETVNSPIKMIMEFNNKL